MVWFSAHETPGRLETRKDMSSNYDRSSILSIICRCQFLGGSWYPPYSRKSVEQNCTLDNFVFRVFRSLFATDSTNTEATKNGSKHSLTPSEQVCPDSINHNGEISVEPQVNQIDRSQRISIASYITLNVSNLWDEYTSHFRENRFWIFFRIFPLAFSKFPLYRTMIYTKCINHSPIQRKFRKR